MLDIFKQELLSEIESHFSHNLITGYQTYSSLDKGIPQCLLIEIMTEKVNKKVDQLFEDLYHEIIFK